jgi:excisionase family DNA binding protein
MTISTMHVGTMRTGEAGSYVILSSPTSDVFPLSEYRRERLLSSIEAAAVLGIHPKTLQRMARSGQIRGIRVGKLWRFRCSDIDMWIERKLAY